MKLEILPGDVAVLRCTSIVLLCFGLGACSTLPQPTKNSTLTKKKPEEPSEEAQRPAPTDQELFLSAGAAFRNKQYDVSAKLYLELVDRSPTGRYATVSRYNGALSLERLKEFERAVPLYEAVAKRMEGSKDAHDALFRAATCLQSAKQWQRAIEVWTRVLRPEYEQISEHDQMEAHVNRAWARENTGDMARAERDYKVVFKLHRENLDNRLIRTTPLVPLAHKRVGYLYGSLVDSIKIKLPVERMARDIEEKANYFLKAQSHLLDAIRRHHPEYSVAAGHRLGTLFEAFYRDLMNAEVPEELDEGDHGVYIRELKKKVKPLIEKAVYTFRRTAELGNRLDYDGEWTQKARGSLRRLEQYIKAEAERERKSDGRPSS